MIPSVLENYQPIDCDEVVKIVLASPTKTCEADPIPTELLKKVLPAIIQLLTKLVNQSLQAGEFPDDLNEALVKPLLKKISLEPILKNYRPVSNLPFIVLKAMDNQEVTCMVLPQNPPELVGEPFWNKRDVSSMD